MTTPPHVLAWLQQAATNHTPGTLDDPNRLRARIQGAAVSPDYYTECTCDVRTEPGPHPHWCATEATKPPRPDDTIRDHIYAWAKAIGLDQWLTSTDYDDLINRLTTETHTEWTWRHNAYTSTAKATTDRAEAERAIAILQRNNPGGPVTLMRRTVSGWTEVTR
ncbi:hypothetical protein ACGF5C_31655 [Micromonospora sp. NPDC047620]|uniref:hypothetical protein n=1 Tax=Micromonospora sp. NPDC047620 TaxID=3364251 RepID=UPI003717096C